MVQTTCCGEGQECIVTDVSGLADPCMASCNVFYRLPDGSIWLLNKDGDGYLPVFVANDKTKIDWNADPDSPNGISNRPFKAIGYGLKIDANGNIALDELALPKPDWNETSPDSKDYIKNKPFQTIGDHLYVEDGALNVCLENRTNELPNSTWNLGKPPWNNPSFNTGYEIVDPEADKPDSHILHARPSTTTTQQMFQIPHPIPVTVGDVITVAFDFKDLNWTQSSNLMVLRVFPERDTPQSQANSVQNVSWNSNTFGITGETTEFRRLVRSFTVTATGFLNVIPYNSDGTGNYEQWYREIMVIKGEECEMPDRWYPYFTDVPMPEQIQSDWDVSDTTSPAYIKNKPEIVEQVQSDWNETNETSPAFILNKPTISGGAHTITLEGSPLDLTIGDHTFSAYDSITEQMDFDFDVTVLESNWDDSLPVRRLMFLEDTIENAMEIKTYRLVSVEYSLPENNFTIDGIMTYRNDGGTFKYELKVSVTKGGGGDTSNFVTLDTEQTINSTKHWGEIITTGQGENGQVTTLNPDGSVTQIQKIAGSNQYTEIEIAYGQVRVSTMLSDGTPLRNAILTETGVHREIDIGQTNMTMPSDWEAGTAICYVTNSTLVVHVEGARPKSTINGSDGGIFKTVATLPNDFFKGLLTHSWDFEWSQYGGGQLTYAGRLDLSDGALKLYLMPPANTITNNNRFNITLTIPILK